MRTAMIVSLIFILTVTSSSCLGEKMLAKRGALTPQSALREFLRAVKSGDKDRAYDQCFFSKDRGERELSEDLINNMLKSRKKIVRFDFKYKPVYLDNNLDPSDEKHATRARLYVDIVYKISILPRKLRSNEALRKNLVWHTFHIKDGYAITNKQFQSVRSNGIWKINVQLISD